MLDFLKMCREYFLGSDMVDSPHSYGDIKLDKVKMYVRPETMNWYDGSLPQLDLPEGTKYKVNISRNPSNQRSVAYGEIRTVNDAEKINIIIEKDGIVKGLGKKLKLPLIDTNVELVHHFGSHLKIDPSKACDEISKRKVRCSKPLEMSSYEATASATVLTKRKEYKGNFECKVVVEGLSTMRMNRCVRQAKLSEVIRSLQVKQRDYLRELKVIGPDQVEFTMRGEVEFYWGFQQTIKLN